MKTQAENLDEKAAGLLDKAEAYIWLRGELDQEKLDELVTDALGGFASQDANDGAPAESSFDASEKLASNWNNRGQPSQIALLLALGHTEVQIEDAAKARDTPGYD